MSDHRTLISVIVPVYNSAAYLDSCLNSITKQTFYNLEIILINDGSSDLSPQICDRYASVDKRIIVIHQKNRGVSSARNIGLRYAKGEYVVFIDSDDIVSSRYIEILHKEAQKRKCDILCCDYTHHEKDLDQILEDYSIKSLNKNEAIINTLYQKDIGNGPFCKMFKLSTLKGIKFDQSITIGEDLLFNYEALQKVKSVQYIQSKIYFYRKRSGSALGSNFRPNKMDELKVTDMLIKDASKLNLPYVKRAAINRHFMAASFIAIQIKKNKYKEFYQVCEEQINKYKTIVLADRSSRFVYRAYAGIAIISVDFAIWLFKIRSLTKKRLSHYE